MEYQHPRPRGYMWQQTQPQSPPPGSDPYQVTPPPPHMPPPTASHPWPYPAPQFQFQRHAAPPPPPQWHPPHQHLPPYPGQQPISYTSQHMAYPQHPHYPQPHQLPPRAPQVSHSYVQDSGTATWSHPQYATNNNEEDWGAKARAWAAAKTANGPVPPPHFPPSGGNQDQNNLQNQYPQPHDPQHSEMHAPIGPPSNYQQHPFPTGPPTEISQSHLQVSQHGCAAESTVPFSSMDRKPPSDSALSPLDQKSSKIQIVHPQEVPSSYSSLAGAGEAGGGIEQINGSSSMPLSSHTHPHVQYQQFAANGKPGWVENPQVLGGRANSVAELSNQPLNFSPHFNHNRDMIVPDPSLRMGTNFAWSPAPATGPGPVYAPVPPPIPSVSHQADPMTAPPPSGPLAPIFPAGPGFQTTLPMIGAAFGAASAVLPHPTSFSVDAYGVSERPKKAPVPNWLREEIIKKKASLGSSAPNIDKVDSPPIEGDGDDDYCRNRDQADSKSIDSSRSVEEEEDDEVALEAVRTTAVNKEIKRILTEVLLKVTEDLFDEVASKVLREDDVSSEACEDADQPEHQNVTSTPSVSTSKASVKVLFPKKYKDAVNELDVHDKSNSSSVGDVLGLASYASDEEEDDDGKSEMNLPELSSSKLLNNSVAMGNGSISGVKIEGTDFTGLEGVSTGQQTPLVADKDQGSSIAKSKDTLGVYHSAAGDDPSYSGRPSDDAIDESKFSKSYEKDAEENDGVRNDSQLKSTLEGSADKSGDIKNLYRKEKKDVENRKEIICDTGDEEHTRRDKKTERVSYNDVSRGKTTERGRAEEKVMKSRSRRAESPYSEQEDMTDMRSKKRSYRDDKGEKWQDRSIDEKNERGKHRGRESKDHSRMSRLNDSSDESSGSGYSRRKSHRSRRDRSPSPVRSRKRQDSPSAHSRHTKRRHSPYSMETTRRKRSPSRSNSPARRRNH